MSSQQPLPHISDVAIWGTADRNYWVYLAFAIVLGFIGADHIYLRSYGTALQKFLFNCVSFGFWYWWDVIQAFTEPEKIKTEGLSRPFDWGSQTIGRGVFGAEQSPDKDYVIYTLLALFLGWLGADRFYIGQWTSGLLKFGSVIFLVGWLWVAFDAINAVFFPRSIVTASPKGSYGFPFSLFEVNGCSQFTLKGEACKNSKQTGGMFGLTAILDWIAKTLRFEYILYPTELGAKGLHAAADAADAVATAMEKGDANPISTAQQVVNPITSSASETTTETTGTTNTPAVEQKTDTASIIQGGGARQTNSTGPVIAGALSALVVAGSLKAIYDFVGSR